MAAQRPSTALLAVALASVALAGCGGEDEEPAGPAVTVEASQPVEIAGGEYFFDPENVVVSDGSQPTELVFDNQGSLAHNLRVFDGETEVGGTETFAGGDGRSARLELEPGAYRLVCTVANHEQLGMTGELEVR